MTEERWERVRALFDEALEHPVDERVALVTAGSAGDELLLHEVLDLLAAPNAAFDEVRRDGDWAWLRKSATATPAVRTVTRQDWTGPVRSAARVAASTCNRSSSVSRLPNPVSMFTAGVSPDSAVRITCAVKPSQSISPLAANGNSTAEIPSTFRRGRSIAIGSMAGNDMSSSRDCKSTASSSVPTRDYIT